MLKFVINMVISTLLVGSVIAGNLSHWRQTEFVAKLYREAAAAQSGNVILSPYGVASVFSLLGTGARGKTQADFSNVLCLDVADANAVAKMFSCVKGGMPNRVVNICDSIWLVNGACVLPKFMDYARNGFGAEARTVGLGELYPSINAYVSEKTHGMIRELLGGTPDPLTRLAVVNTVYFCGKWADKFDKSQTRNSVFHAPTGYKQVPFMNDMRKAALSYPNGHRGLKALKLPYRDAPIEAVFILPPVGKDIKSIEAKLDSKTLGAMLRSPFGGKQNVKISIPKFEFESMHNLVPVLSHMGLGVAFGPGADFSGISKEEIYVDKALQKAKIRVDEEGTVASAATVAIMLTKSGRRPEHEEFIANRPFLFVIRNYVNGAILFMGRVTDPERRDCGVRGVKGVGKGGKASGCSTPMTANATPTTSPMASSPRRLQYIWGGGLGNERMDFEPAKT